MTDLNYTLKQIKLCHNKARMVVLMALLWNAKLTETRIFRELSIEIESSLIELKSSLIQLKSSLNKLESSLIRLCTELFNSIVELSIYV